MPDRGATTLEEILRESRAILRAGGVEDPALESRILVEHFTGTTRAHAITAPRRPVDAEIATTIMQAIARRRAGEPVYRIIGRREFHGLDLELSQATLEPRPDTETLVEEVIPFALDVAERTGNCRILDLGTGTGAIALALLWAVPAAHAVGVDISDEALETARQNADRLGLGERFETLRSDWFSKVSGLYDVIVSNPPYIPTNTITTLDRAVRDFDPIAALDGGRDGLDAYRRIAEGARKHLGRDARIAVEIGYDQKADVSRIFMEAGYRLLAARRDLAENDRVLVFSA